MRMSFSGRNSSSFSDLKCSVLERRVRTVGLQKVSPVGVMLQSQSEFGLLVPNIETRTTVFLCCVYCYYIWSADTLRSFLEGNLTTLILKVFPESSNTVRFIWMKKLILKKLHLSFLIKTKMVDGKDITPCSLEEEKNIYISIYWCFFQNVIFSAKIMC